jgi:hypothetical protein
VNLYRTAYGKTAVDLYPRQLHLYSDTAKLGSAMDHKKHYSAPHLISYSPDKVPKAVTNLFQDELIRPAKPLINEDESNETIQLASLRASPKS